MNTTVLFAPAAASYTVQFAYSPAVVEALKAVVPAAARSWSREARKWTVEADWAQTLAEALRRAGCTIIGLDDPPRPPRRDSAAWAREMFRAVGPHRIPAVHRALSKVLHPDNAATGCPMLQRELNDARAEIEVKS